MQLLDWFMYSSTITAAMVSSIFICPVVNRIQKRGQPIAKKTYQISVVTGKR